MAKKNHGSSRRRTPKLKNSRSTKPTKYVLASKYARLLEENAKLALLNDFNGMAQFNPFGFPQNSRVLGTAQLSQTDTIFINLRYYLASNFRQVLSQAYVELGLIQTIVDVPVDDALRGGIEIKTKQLDEEQINQLLNAMDRNDDLGIAAQAGKWDRLFGGAGVMILTDQDPETELDVDAIGPDTPLEFRAVDLWELFWDRQNSEGYDPEYQTQEFDHYVYYGQKVHKSRVMRLKGQTAPSFIRPRLRGWGTSVVEQLVRPINQFLKAGDLTFEVMDEFKIDYYKLKGLVTTLDLPNGDEKIRQRVQIANEEKNYHNAVVLDSEDEFAQKQLTFSGLAEVQKENKMDVAASLKMPLTKVFGISAAGFNSGEDDIEVYNGMVESTVRRKLKYIIMRQVELNCQRMFGFIPDDLTIEFQPLRVLGAVDQETVKTQKYTRLMGTFDKGLITPKQFIDSANRGKLFDMKMDDPPAVLLPAGQAAEGVTDPEKPVDVDDQGAGRAEAPKPKAGDKGGIPKGEVKKTPEAKEVKKVENSLENQRDRDGVALRVGDTVRHLVPGGKIGTIESFQGNEANIKTDDGHTMRMDCERLELQNSPQAKQREAFRNSFDQEASKFTNEYVMKNMAEAKKANGPMWEKAKETSKETYGEYRYPFIMWLYERMGGKT